MKKSFMEDLNRSGDVIDRVTYDEEIKHKQLLLETVQGDLSLSIFTPPFVSAPQGMAEEIPPPEELPQKREEALPATPAPPEKKSLTHRKDGIFDCFTSDSITYRLGGIKPLFVTSLRVNIRATNGILSYYDSVDLYASRSRTSFAQGLYKSWEANPVKVEQDLTAILEFLEGERDKALEAKRQPAKRELSEEEKQLGMNLLRERDIMKRITDDIQELGCVGEELNKQLVYLCASSRKLDDPISVLIVSQSASGKSFLIDTVKRLMPTDEVISVTSLSDQALNYIDDLTHKFLVLGEAVHGETVEYQIREMLSGKELSRLVTVKDAETGAMSSRIVRTPVIVSSIMSSTNYSINAENASRCFLINTDESAEQTQRIQQAQRRRYSLQTLQTGSAKREQIIKTHRAAQKLLVKRNIVNDFAPLLNFPAKLMRARRDHDRFLDLIACVCYLRQYQKKTETINGVEFIRCDSEDYKTAYRIMVCGVLSSTMRELGESTHQLYEQLRQYCAHEAQKQQLSITEVAVTQRQLREYSGHNHMNVKIAVRQLLDYEYITVVRGGSQRSKGFYRLKEDAPLCSIDTSMIPTPAAMEKLMENKSGSTG